MGCMWNISTHATAYLWHLATDSCQWLTVSVCLGSEMVTWTHPAAVGIGYTDGLGAAKEQMSWGPQQLVTFKKLVLHCCKMWHKLKSYNSTHYNKTSVATLNDTLHHMALNIHNWSCIICLVNYHLPSAFLNINVIATLTKRKFECAAVQMKDWCLKTVLHASCWMSVKSFRSYNQWIRILQYLWEDGQVFQVHNS
jgi:hypothetical protein